MTIKLNKVVDYLLKRDFKIDDINSMYSSKNWGKIDVIILSIVFLYFMNSKFRINSRTLNQHRHLKEILNHCKTKNIK